MPGYYVDPSWSVRDVMGHVGTWLAEAGVQFERIRAGTYEGHDVDIDALNASFLEAMRGQPWEVAWTQANAGRTRMRQAWTGAPRAVGGGGVVDPQVGGRSLRRAPRPARGMGRGAQGEGVAAGSLTSPAKRRVIGLMIRFVNGRSGEIAGTAISRSPGPRRRHRPAARCPDRSPTRDRPVTEDQTRRCGRPGRPRSDPLDPDADPLRGVDDRGPPRGPAAARRGRADPPRRRRVGARAGVGPATPAGCRAGRGRSAAAVAGGGRARRGRGNRRRPAGRSPASRGRRSSFASVTRSASAAGTMNQPSRRPGARILLAEPA